MKAIRSDDNLILWIKGIRELSNTLNPGTNMRLVEAKRLVDMMRTSASTETNIKMGVWYKSKTIKGEQVRILSSFKTPLQDWYYIVEPIGHTPFVVPVADIHEVLEPPEH